MFLSVTMTVLCMLAVAFYMRFLFALFRECQTRLIGYWVRLRLGSCEGTIVEMQERTKPVTRAA
jgi:hypothetical protein